MRSSSKYVALAIVIAVGLYCMDVSAMDGALVFAAIAAACIILDRFVLSGDENCTCEYSIDQGSLYENFEARAELSKTQGEKAVTQPNPASVLKNETTISKKTEKTVSSTEVSGVTATSTPKVDSLGDRSTGELGYSQIPIDALKNASERIELKPRAHYGEVFVDPEAWHPPCLKAPICVTSNSCQVQPVFTNGTYIDLLEWDESRRITPPSAMDSEYMDKVLNAGISK